MQKKKNKRKTTSTGSVNIKHKRHKKSPGGWVRCDQKLIPANISMGE